jgi:heme exporter protein C
VWDWIKRTYHRWGSPRYFYQYARRGMVAAGLIAGVSLLVGLIWSLAFAPPDYQQGNSFRIIYIHVPAASVGMGFYALIAGCAFVSWVWKMKMADVVAEAAAPIGACFTFLSLFTGAVWGKPTWGTYWVWDARLTSMLILLFLYLGLMALRQSIASTSAGNKMCNLLAMVGAINLPIIKYSVEWWNTLHQPATFTITDKPAMPPEMWVPLLVMLLGTYALSVALLFYRTNTLILMREKRSQWVRDLLP